MSVLLSLLCALLALSLASVTAGTQMIPFSESWQALFRHSACHSESCDIVYYARLPRTLAGLIAGVALGLAGILMQSLTRNPLADPGILGVNSGAAFATVLGISVWDIQSPLAGLGLAFLGAFIVSLMVALTGSGRGGRLNPVRLTLAGVSLAAILEGVTTALSLLNPYIYDHLRFWQSGTLDIRQFDSLRLISPGVIACALVVLAMAKSLNNLQMGVELAQALGTRVFRVQILGLVMIALLAGSATALTGPIAFIGLMAPHLARLLVGDDHRRMLPATFLLTPCLLLLADMSGRVISAGEIRVSVVASVMGAPVLIWLIRRQSGGMG